MAAALILNQKITSLLVGLVLSFAGAAMAGAQASGACVDSASSDARSYKHGYSLMVSRTDTASARQRTNLGLPTLSADQVQLVADTTVCRLASAAFDSAAAVSHPTTPVIVLALGTTRRIVIKDIGFHGPWLNLLFDQTFTSMLTKIGY
jgi:hypothetical protein